MFGRATQLPCASSSYRSKHKGTACGWVEQTLRPRMHALVATSVAAAASAGINKRGRPYAFELLGYDFMVDDDLRVWLIEVRYYIK